MGAQVIVAPQTRDLGILSQKLTGWLAARLPQSDDVHLFDLVYPAGAGMSHETILFQARWRERGQSVTRGLVVRIKPTQQTVYLDDMFDAQYRMMTLMHAQSAVRVAEPLWFEPSDALLGAPFFVMAKVEGRVAVSYPPYSREGWLLGVACADRRLLWEDAVRQLAEIQRIDVTSADFLARRDIDDDFFHEVDRWQRYLDWVDPTGERALLRSAFARLLTLLPNNRPAGIVWGDARLGNMMIGADHSVAAVMDWEQPSLGGALHDLAWWLVSDYNQTTGQGLPRLEGMGSREETIALWADVSGKTPADLGWYEVFAAFKMDCLAVRMMALRGHASIDRSFEPGARTSEMLEALV